MEFTIFKNGKSTINGPFSIATLNHQRVFLSIDPLQGFPVWD
jgi:hypothetical protein